MTRKDQSGFTLVESVIALTVTSMLIFVVVNFMVNSIAQYSTVNARSRLLNEAQIALDIIGDDIRLSANADENNRWPDANAPIAPDNLFSWTSSPSTLILATAAEDVNGDIIFSDQAEYISLKDNNVYFVRDRKLYKRTLAADGISNTSVTTCPANETTANCPTDKQLLAGVDSFNLKYFNEKGEQVTPTDARSVEMYVKISEDQYRQPVSAEYTTRMVFRND